MERTIKFQIAERNFPEEIVEDILSRLPVISLLRFRCVSKSWRSLIDSERFIKIHLKKLTQNDRLPYHRIILNPVLSTDRILKTLSWASLLEGPTDKPVEFDEGKYIDREVKIVGCSYGLVCLVQDKGRFILWNPATRMCVHLPDPHIRRVGEAKFRMYGFGYVESSDDYKVFVIITPNKRKTIGKLYSLKSNSWKTLKRMKVPSVGVKAGVFVSDNLHWFQEEEHLPSYEDPDLYSFDLEDEEFGMVGKSYVKSAVIIPSQTVGVIDGCLSVLCTYLFYYSSEVWVMKEYGVEDSWVRLCTISNFNHRPMSLERVQSFCKGPNGEVLLIYNSALMIYQYNARDDEFRCSFIINIDEVMGDGVYVESLVSLGPNAEGERF